MTRRPIAGSQHQQGKVLAGMLVLTAMLLLGALPDQRATVESGRRQATEAALMQAREALIGFAATYRDTRDTETARETQSFGYLPCPSSENDGISEMSCGLTLVSVLGRLPWKSLDLANYRDSAGECLWYAISGRAKNNPKTYQLNWDTPGQLLVQDIAGKLQHDPDPHTRPLAVVIAPGRPLPGQASRRTQGSNQCADIGAPNEHLENIDSRWYADTHTGDIVITTGNDASSNDQAIWLNATDIFDRIKRRKDFKSDIETMMDDLAAYLEARPPDQLPAPSKAQKGVALLIDNYLESKPSQAKKAVIHHWRDNLLYIVAPGQSRFALDLDGRTRACRAVLFFAGERTPWQRRSSADEIEDWRMYLEGDNANTYPALGKYVGTSDFRPENSSADILRCIGR